VIPIGSTADVDTKIDEGQGFAYYPEGRMWVTHYPATALGAARGVYTQELEGMEAGYTALYQKCVHLGCRVPECTSSQWFECQCHGSQYNRNGEKKGGPAPRGLDRFPLAVTNGNVSVNTGIIITGPPIGTNTTGQEAEGPHCVGGGDH
jgi:cytochrome b6-f complex iron-sulfur subunit